MEKYFMHRIQKDNGVYTKGIEVHDTLDSAVLSFWGRMKTGFGKSTVTFISCKITDGNGKTVDDYDMTWKAGSENVNVFFLHHIRLDGETFDKAIDIMNSIDTARGDFAEQMEYGYNNPQHPDVSFVSCQITDLLSGGMELMTGTWSKKEETVPEE